MNKAVFHKREAIPCYLGIVDVDKVCLQLRFDTQKILVSNLVLWVVSEGRIKSLQRFQGLLFL